MTIETLTYQQLKANQQSEVDAFPLGFAFNRNQFEQMKRYLPLREGEKYVSIGAGAYVRRNDLQAFDDMAERHNDELMQAMESEAFAVEAFRYELGNHEYVISGDPAPALRALGLDESDVNESEHLTQAFQRARREYLKGRR